MGGRLDGIVWFLSRGFCRLDEFDFCRLNDIIQVLAPGCCRLDGIVWFLSRDFCRLDELDFCRLNDIIAEILTLFNISYQ